MHAFARARPLPSARRGGAARGRFCRSDSELEARAVTRTAPAADRTTAPAGGDRGRALFARQPLRGPRRRARGRGDSASCGEQPPRRLQLARPRKEPAHCDGGRYARWDSDAWAHPSRWSAACSGWLRLRFAQNSSTYRSSEGKRRERKWLRTRSIAVRALRKLGPALHGYETARIARAPSDRPPHRPHDRL